MFRRAVPFLLLYAAIGCGGAGQSTSTAMPVDPTMRSNGNPGGPVAEAVYKPSAGVNVPLGKLTPLAPKSPFAKPPTGKIDKESAVKLAKLGKDPLKLDDAYSYIVAPADAPHATVGEKGASVPLPTEAKANPDGSYWVVDAETRRIYTLTGVKKVADKPTTVVDAPSGDLVHPMPDSPVPPLALVARADEATTGVTHALRIVAKGVGTEGGPPEGAMIRLKKGVSEKDVPLLTKAVFRALKKYGATLTAGDGAPALSALSDPRWTKEDEKAMSVLHFGDFELFTPPTKSTKTTEISK